MSFKFSINSVFSFFKYYSLPLLSAVLMGTAYIPFPFFGWFFAWIPLWHFIYKQKNLKQVLIGVWICQFLATLIGFNWVAYTIHYFGQMPWIVSIIGLFFFCSFANIFMVIAGGLCFILIQKKPQTPIALKLLLFPIFFSLFHTLIPTIFPWNMSYTWLWMQLPAFQTAELWGFRFLNTLFYIFNLLFWLVFKHKWDGIGKTALASAIALLTILNGLGIYLKKRLPSSSQKQLQVLLVQHNIGQLQNLKLKKNFRNIPEQVYFQIKERTYKGLIRNRKTYTNPESIHFILWPEGAYPYLVPKHLSRIKDASSLVQKVKIPLITGGTSRGSKGYSNSIITLSREGKILKPIYDKSILLAFGEYMPGIFSLPFIQKLLPYFHGRFAPGPGPKILNLEGVSIGFQICYESLFDFYIRTLAKKGAQVLLNVTNDSWYGSWQEPWQHLYMSLARAVETRRPLIRGTNTGLSTVIQANGTIMKISPLNKEWTHLYSIPYREKPQDTLFMSWGFYINEIFLLLLSLLGLAATFIHRP